MMAGFFITRLCNTLDDAIEDLIWSRLFSVIFVSTDDGDEFCGCTFPFIILRLTDVRGGDDAPVRIGCALF